MDYAEQRIARKQSSDGASSAPQTASSRQARGPSGKPVDPLSAERQQVARQLKRSVNAMADEDVDQEEEVRAVHAKAMTPTVARKVMRAEAAPAPGASGEPPVPKTQDAYNAHLRVKFAAQFAELKTIAEAFKAKGGEIKTKEAELSINAEERKQLEDQFAGKKGELTEDEKKLKERMQMLQAIAPHEGKRMEDLLKQAKDLLKTHGDKRIKDEGDRKLLESLMLAAIKLNGDIEPEGAGKGRILYTETIDKQENGRLVALAETQRVPPAECAALAVNYRNWARAFFRSEVMTNQDAAEVLYLRDLGIAGSREGLTPQQVMEKVFGNIKKDKGIDPNLKFDEASEEQKLEVYKGMIESAKKTNAGATAGSTGGKK